EDPHLGWQYIDVAAILTRYEAGIELVEGGGGIGHAAVSLVGAEVRKLGRCCRRQREEREAQGLKIPDTQIGRFHLEQPRTAPRAGDVPVFRCDLFALRGGLWGIAYRSEGEWLQGCLVGSSVAFCREFGRAPPGGVLIAGLYRRKG